MVIGAIESTTMLAGEPPLSAHARTAILAFSTDGILSTEPLNLPVSEEMGDWDLETFEAAALV